MAQRKPLTSDSTLDRCAQAPGMSTLARAYYCSSLGVRVDQLVLIKVVVLSFGLQTTSA